MKVKYLPIFCFVYLLHSILLIITHNFTDSNNVLVFLFLADSRLRPTWTLVLSHFLEINSLLANDFELWRFMGFCSGFISTPLYSVHYLPTDLYHCICWRYHSNTLIWKLFGKSCMPSKYLLVFSVILSPGCYIQSWLTTSNSTKTEVPLLFAIHQLQESYWLKSSHLLELLDHAQCERMWA